MRQEASAEHQERSDVTDAKRLHDIKQQLRCWGYLSHHPDAERAVAWLLDRLAERDARVRTGRPLASRPPIRLTPSSTKSYTAFTRPPSTR